MYIRGMKKSLRALSLFALLAGGCSQQSSNLDWPVYGGSKENTRYSAAIQIDSSNVHLLQQAWTFRTGDEDSSTQIQVNPLVVDGVLYGISPKLKLFALDAATGQQQWVYDPVTDSLGEEIKGEGYFSFNIARGLAMYTNAAEKLLLSAILATRVKLICAKASTAMQQICMWQVRVRVSYTKT